MEILLLEDDVALARGVQLALATAERQFVVVHSLADAKMWLRTNVPDLLIADIGLPDGSGLDLVANLRATGYQIPIMLLTANDTELDQVTGLSSGADDYVTKPFSLGVLRARVDALLRRGGSSSGRFVFPGFVFDFETARFFKDDDAVELSKTEARLLQLLVVNAGQTVTRERLSQEVWPNSGDFLDPNALSVTVRRLRMKLETDPAKPQRILTVHGLGYKWAK
jgi:DNA-binding response OmpR family regulator